MDLMDLMVARQNSTITWSGSANPRSESFVSIISVSSAGLEYAVGPVSLPPSKTISNHLLRLLLSFFCLLLAAFTKGLAEEGAIGGQPASGYVIKPLTQANILISDFDLLHGIGR
jgi:hypothetical protein